MFSRVAVKVEFWTSWFSLSKLCYKKTIIQVQIMSKLLSYEIEWNPEKWKEKGESQ